MALLEDAGSLQKQPVSNYGLLLSLLLRHISPWKDWFQIQRIHEDNPFIVQKDFCKKK